MNKEFLQFFQLGILFMSLYGIIIYLLITAENNNHIQRQK